MPSTRPRICLYAGRFESSSSGLWVYFSSVLEALLVKAKEQEADFEFICLAQGDERIRAKLSELQEAFEDFSWEALPESFLGRRFDTFRDGFVKREDFSLIHGLCNFAPFQNSSLLFLTIHDLIALEAHSELSLYARLRSATYKCLFRKSLERASHVFSVSEHAAREIKETFDLESLPEVLYSPLEKAFLEKDLHFPLLEERNAVLAFAATDRRKNIERAIEAICPWLLDGGELRVLCSNEQVAERVQSFARERALERHIFCDLRIPAKDLPEYYRQFRALLFPSLAEGFGYPVYEAISQGLPVVHSRGICVEELKEDTREMRSECSPRSVESIREAFIGCLRRKFPEETRTRAAQRVRERLRAARVATALLNAYSEALHR